MSRKRRCELGDARIMGDSCKLGSGPNIIGLAHMKLPVSMGNLE